MSCRIWLLSPTNVAFGVGAAYMNGYFNAQVAAPLAGTAAVGALAALTVATAALGAVAFSSWGQQSLGQPMAVGSLEPWRGLREGI